MGNWYRVTKKIHGRYYDYWQRTERHGRSVKTFNKYIGPTTTAPGPIHGWNHMSSAARHNARMDKLFATAMQTKKDHEALREADAQFPTYSRKINGSYHDFHVQRSPENSKYYVMTGPASNQRWIDRGFDSPKEAVDYAVRQQH